MRQLCHQLLKVSGAKKAITFLQGVKLIFRKMPYEKPPNGRRSKRIRYLCMDLDRILPKMCMLFFVLEVWGSLRCFLEGVLQSHDPRLAELVSTCQTSGQVACSHSANSRPDMWPVFDVQAGTTSVLCSRS